jgi:hypothetical protein
MRNQPLDLSDAEMAVVRQIAEREGITEDEAATQLVQKEIARRVKKRTGRNPARVYSLKRK